MYFGFIDLVRDRTETVCTPADYQQGSGAVRIPRSFVLLPLPDF